MVYKVDAYYAPESEGGLRWDDEVLQIAWPTRDPLVSDKDKRLPSFKEFVHLSSECVDSSSGLGTVCRPLAAPVRKP